MARSGRLLNKTRMTHRAFVAWMAVFALFAQVLAPLSAAWAFDAKSPSEVLVICTANGIQTTTIGGDGTPIETPTYGVACPFCVLHVSAAVFSPSLTSSMPAYAGLTRHTFSLPRADVQVSLGRAQPCPPRGPPHTA